MTIPMKNIYLTPSQISVRKHSQHPPSLEYRPLDRQWPMSSSVCRLDAYPSQAQPHRPDSQLAMAQPHLHELLHNGLSHKCPLQLHGALQQSVVSVIHPSWPHSCIGEKDTAILTPPSVKASNKSRKAQPSAPPSKSFLRSLLVPSQTFLLASL